MSQTAAKIKPNVEPDEPTVEDSTVPVWFIFLMAILVYLGLSYLDRHGGWFSPDVFEPYRTKDEVTSLQPHNPEMDYYLLGQKTFNASCSLCHQPNGMGKEGQFPPLAGSDWINAPGANRIGRIVLNGLSGNVRVETSPPVQINASMAPLGPTYNDEQLGAALTYVRKQWGNNAPKVTPEQIKRIRAEIGARTSPFKEEELKAIPVGDPGK